MKQAPLRAFGVLCLSALLVPSCSNPEKEKLRHLQLGDEYAAQKRDEFAVVEYASAVKIDPKFGEARFKLAEAYERMGNIRAAAPEYIRAADALPNDRKAQLKAAQLLLLGGRFEDAKARVATLLAQNPKDVDALLLQASAMTSLRDPAGAMAQIEEALRVSPDSSQAFARLGVVRMASGEAKEAEAAFRQAVALDPSSVDAQLALATFLWAADRTQEAEAILKQTLSKEPRQILANRMLAGLYLATGRPREAEQPLTIVVESSTTPAARFQLADYYARIGRTKEAANLLTKLSADQTTFAEAESKLAALDYSEGRVPEAHKRLDAVLARASRNAPLLVMKTQWLAVENKLDEALEWAQKAVAADAESASAHFALAVVHDRRREAAEAIQAYREALRLNPRMTAAQVALSRLNLTSGDTTAALQYAEQARHADPSSLDARVALARGLIVSGNLPRAESEIAELLKGAPNSAVVHAVNGTLQTRRNNVAAAQRSFERALELSPGFIDALAGLTYLDILAKNPARAIARLEPEIARQPNNGRLLVMLARAQSAAKDDLKAELTLRRAVSVDPRFTEGYVALAQLFIRQGRLDEARAEFEGIGQRDPSAIGPRTMVGILYEVQGKPENAKKAYEAAISASDNAPVAANNLAFIYAAEGTKLDVALQLATSAKQKMPDDPNVDDTIGWIYYKKDLPSLAVGPLEDSLRKRPDTAEVLFHLGLTYAKLGEKAKSRNALERALKLDPKVGGDEARRTLAEVSK